MKRFLLPFLMVFAIAALVMATAPANASFMLKIDDPSTVGVDVIVIDDQLGGTFSSGPPAPVMSTVADGNMGQSGVVSYNSAIAGTVWTVNVTVGVSKPVLPQAKMDMVSVNVSSGGAGILDLYLTDTDFSLPNGVYSFTNAIGGTTGGTVTAQGYTDNLNWEFYTAQASTALMGPFGPGAFSGTASGSNILDNQFSMTEWVRIVHTGADQITSFDKELSVPEPGTMLLIGTGLLGLAGLGRRKLFKK